MEKYWNVASWYVGQHPVMFVVLGLAIAILCGMVWEAHKMEAELDEEEDDENI